MTDPFPRSRTSTLLLGIAAALLLGDAVQAAPKETQYVAADGTQYAFRAYGPADGPTLVLSQRFRGNMDDWDPAFIDALDDTHRVIVFNASGISSSTGEVPQTIDGMADDMARFMRAAGFEDADVLGWSMGGFVVHALAMRHPDLVDRLILVGTGPAASPETPAPVDGVFEVATTPEYGEDEREYLFFADAPSSLARADASIRRIDAARDTESEPASTLEAMQVQAGAILHWLGEDPDGFSGLSSIQSPTLIVSGDRDPFFPAMAGVLLYREIPNARLAIYPMAGHGPHHQWPEHVASLIRDFVADTAE
ncbi:alpha/beta hydrolase [uncultured Roseobacter sp.]|uniref:alpha/beta fold hydrolase n=1 Tax=uncultured Roseobacter sp. TaxID=114847 RepID=UPI00260BF1A1|nr:alpha/beta hydrolase [uncultured Roseobacter sp.]